MNPIQIITEISQSLNIPSNKVASTLKLLKDEGCTVPFIARYRKEATGAMDEVQIRDIDESFEAITEREKRRTYIMETIEKMKMMTPELKRKILNAATQTILEDLYAPFKSKKKTKAQIAKDFGLEPLSIKIFETKTLIAESELTKFVDGKNIKNTEEALSGATDIIIETFAHDTEVKERLRDHLWTSGKMTSEKKKDAEKIKDADKFRDFFEFTETLSSLKNPKSSHRFLAMRRGMTLKVLKMEIMSEIDFTVNLLKAKYFSQDKLAYSELLKNSAEKAYKTYIHNSLDLEIKTELKKIADAAAIDVFGTNLKDLLLSPYLGSKAIMGIDPGIRTGCKVVLISKTGKFLGDHVIYPFEPKNDVKGSKVILEKMIEMFDIEYIAIGNGTFGRETLEFVDQNIAPVKEGKVKATMVSEAGASIYSASDIARLEFPDKDVTVRGAISIARRFQDPLAELVKIDPKSIGVGQYQHDVNQIRLKKSLHGVVESCVNYCGVDLNTASAPLLSYISGIGPSVAENIVKYREKNKGIKNRAELLSVPRFTQKVFEQSAGFLRIYQSENPLDATFIHPERYSHIERWCQENKVKLSEIATDKELISKLENSEKLKKELGEYTFKDIIDSLKAPAQDPRTTFKSVDFDKRLKSFSDLKIGSWYQGVVNNITMFGAFVDVGIKESGLLHISQISNEFIENAMDKLKVGQELKVKVIDLDTDRKRISLSLKSEDQTIQAQTKSSTKNKPNVKPQTLQNNAFGGLKNFKIK